MGFGAASSLGWVLVWLLGSSIGFKRVGKASMRSGAAVEEEEEEEEEERGILAQSNTCHVSRLWSRTMGFFEHSTDPLYSAVGTTP